MRFLTKECFARSLFVISFFSLMFSFSVNMPVRSHECVQTPHKTVIAAVKTAVNFSLDVPHFDFHTKVDNINPIALQQENSDEIAYVKTITERYNVNDKLARQVVQLAHKYADSVFPTAQDIIAIIGIESGFDPRARSELTYDPAVGLTQVRTKVWKKLIKGNNIHDIENQIRVGAEILSRYYHRAHSRDGAVIAYNVGITAYKQGQRNWRYLRKYKRELAFYQ